MAHVHSGRTGESLKEQIRVWQCVGAALLIHSYVCMCARMLCVVHVRHTRERQQSNCWQQSCWLWASQQRGSSGLWPSSWYTLMSTESYRQTVVPYSANSMVHSITCARRVQSVPTCSDTLSLQSKPRWKWVVLLLRCLASLSVLRPCMWPANAPSPSSSWQYESFTSSRRRGKGITQKTCTLFTSGLCVAYLSFTCANESCWVGECIIALKVPVLHHRRSS